MVDFKLWSCCQCCILYFGWFPGVWIIFADVSEQSAPSSWVVWTRIMKMEQSVSKCGHINSEAEEPPKRQNIFYIYS